jgi:hypothetical protein
VNKIQISTLTVLQEACEFYVMSLLEDEWFWTIVYWN